MLHRTRRGLGVLVLVVSVLGLMAPPATVQAQGTIAVPNEDAVMAAAIAKAQSSIATFWGVVDKPGPTDTKFAVKIHYPTSGKGGEHIWASVVKHDAAEVTAVISNDPQDIANLKRGQTVTVPKTRLTDWMFFRNDKIHGGQTIRALLPKLPPAQAEGLRAMLAPE